MTLQQKSSISASNQAPSWLLTFADLLGIVLAIFVLIYATSDRKADEFHQAILRLAATLSPEQIQPDNISTLDVMTRQGYQIALLKKQVNAMAYWTLEERNDETLLLELRGQRLINALGDGTWLDVIERFEKDVTLTVYAMDMRSDSEAYASAAALIKMREKRGLSAPWVVAVEESSDKGAVQAQVIVHLGADTAQRRFVEPLGTQSQTGLAEAQ